MNPLEILNKEPVVIASAVRAVLWALVLLGAITLEEPQLAAIALALEAVLALFTRSRVTPVA
jgi:hypothetical protein